MQFRKILGDEFLKGEHHYKVNTDITAMLVAVLLDSSETKEMVCALCGKLFKNCFLGYLDDVMENVDEKNMIPLPMDYYVIRR